MAKFMKPALEDGRKPSKPQNDESHQCKGKALPTTQSIIYMKIVLT